MYVYKGNVHVDKVIATTILMQTIINCVNGMTHIHVYYTCNF